MSVKPRPTKAQRAEAEARLRGVVSGALDAAWTSGLSEQAARAQARAALDAWDAPRNRKGEAWARS